MKFNERLRELRKNAHLSQADLAKQMGVSKSSINMWERGERDPGTEHLETLADIFNCDLDYLLGRTEIKNAYQSQGSVISELQALAETLDADGQKELLRIVKQILKLRG